MPNCQVKIRQPTQKGRVRLAAGFTRARRLTPAVRRLAVTAMTATGSGNRPLNLFDSRPPGVAGGAQATFVSVPGPPAPGIRRGEARKPSSRRIYRLWDRRGLRCWCPVSGTCHVVYCPRPRRRGLRPVGHGPHRAGPVGHRPHTAAAPPGIRNGHGTIKGAIRAGACRESRRDTPEADNRRVHNRQKFRDHGRRHCKLPATGAKRALRGSIAHLVMVMRRLFCGVCAVLGKLPGFDGRRDGAKPGVHSKPAGVGASPPARAGALGCCAGRRRRSQGYFDRPGDAASQRLGAPCPAEVVTTCWPVSAPPVSGEPASGESGSGSCGRVRRRVRNSDGSCR
jgi:hypothetical protein